MNLEKLSRGILGEPFVQTYGRVLRPGVTTRTTWCTTTGTGFGIGEQEKPAIMARMK